MKAEALKYVVLGLDARIRELQTQQAAGKAEIDKLTQLRDQFGEKANGRVSKESALKAMWREQKRQQRVAKRELVHRFKKVSPKVNKRYRRSLLKLHGEADRVRALLTTEPQPSTEVRDAAGIKQRGKWKAVLVRLRKLDGVRITGHTSGMMLSIKEGA